MPDAPPPDKPGAARREPIRGLPTGGVALWLVPVLVTLAITLPKAWQGEFSVDTGWYGAIAHQGFTNAIESAGGSLWRLEHADGQPFFNKPPLGLWLGGLFLAPLGKTVVAARLGAVLGACCCVLLTTAIGRRLGGARMGMFAGLFCATSIEFVRHARSFSLDIWLALFLLGALACAIEAERRARRDSGRAGAWVLTAGGCIGLALMVKPLIGLLAVPAIGAWLVWMGRARLTLWLFPALLASVLVAGPWHLAMWLTDGEGFSSTYFGAQIGSRLGGSGEAAGVIRANEGASSPWYYLVVVATKGWPWIPLVLLALVATLRGKFADNERSAMRLVLVWTVLWLVALSLVGDKRPRYMLPVYPVWALAAAVWFVRLAPEALQRAGDRAAALSAPVALGVGILVSILPIRVHGDRSEQWDGLFDWMRQQRVEPDRVWSGGFEGAQAARVYMEFGWWARIPEARDGPGGSPEPGDVILYFADEAARPGGGEVVVFEQGKVIVSRVGEPAD